MLPTASEPKLTLAGENEMLVNVVEEAVPLSATVVVSFEAESSINKVPERLPAAEGLKVTLTEQVAAAASVVPQEFD